MELLNCPFCGGEKVHVYAAVRNSQERIYPFARCMGCYLDLPGENDDYSYDGKTAIAAWNTRTPDPAQAELLREAVAVLEAFTKAMDMHLGRDHEWAICDADDRARAILARIKESTDE